ncbi:hypothetical protein [Actinoplanes sp. NPDC051851]|uniref:hypothetical protein n=1 Tax=Actinoplanes sp. NPDC051851 TaxID=3154753 RepID=UPI0034471C91
MLSPLAGRWILAATLTMGLAACTDDGVPTAAPSPSASAVPCRTDLDESRDGLLQVAEIWPDSASDVHGYGRAEYDAAGCAAEGYLASPQPVDCAGSFPWISDQADRTDAIFGASGVEYLYTATVRGHDPVPDDEVLNPLEVREVVLSLHGDDDAADHPVTVAAKQCGSVISGLPFTAYRTKVHSVTLGADITGMLAAVGSRIVWLEFDERGWTEDDYRTVLKLAVAESADQ